MEMRGFRHVLNHTGHGVIAEGLVLISENREAPFAEARFGPNRRACPRGGGHQHHVCALDVPVHDPPFVRRL